MKYLSVKNFSAKWNLSERTIRNYCAHNIIEGALLDSGEWKIPENSVKPRRKNERKNKNHLLEKLRLEKKNLIKGGIYHKIQIDMTYNSNHIEGNELSHDETRYIFETRTIGLLNDKKTKKIDDILETINHFSCIDRVIEFANYELSETFIKELHKTLKAGTNDSRLPYFAVGDYKKRPNTVGGIETTLPLKVKEEMSKLIGEYNSKDNHSFDEILDFHVEFERIHPFQDGNGRVGRLIGFKECLKNNIVPFIISENIELFYYRGLKEWNEEKGYLRDTCFSGQDLVVSYLNYFNIAH